MTVIRKNAALILALLIAFNISITINAKEAEDEIYFGYEADTEERILSKMNTIKLQ